MINSFKDVSANPNNEKWENIIKRENEITTNEDDFRSCFERDYTRIIHTTAYRRMKHKTQVFFSPENDHICTRIEHVVLVESISYTIAKALGLNVELTKAIATAHDIGHSPFGHQGEKILSQLAKRDIGEDFWHEKHGLENVDKIELLEGKQGIYKNLNLTYGVRDGIISHCGEIDENRVKPRDEFINLYDYKYPNQFAPYTWEGCVVKIADKISYLGRDIKDAIRLGFFNENLKALYKFLKLDESEVINNSSIINDLVKDLINNSQVEKGLAFSEEGFNKINMIKKFNYQNIYITERMIPSIKYFAVVIGEIYETLKASRRNKRMYQKMYPEVIKEFYDWYSAYTNTTRDSKYGNDIIFDVNSDKDFYKAIICYIAGMTDNYAIKTYEKIIRF